MSKPRVLIVDDSAVARRMIAQSLGARPDVEVAGVAASGASALAMLNDTAPDAVILDVEMPDLDGIETLTKLRQTHPDLPVIMFSALTERGARSTLHALAAGADDYVAKPSGRAGQTLEQVVSELLVPKLIALTETRSFTMRPPRAAPERPGPKPGPVEIVAIAASTGGPNALAMLTSRLPKDFPVPIVIVQHMPPVFTRCLSERLDSTGPLRVSEAQGDEPLGAGTIWIARGDYHLEVAQTTFGTRTVLTQAPQENSCRPAADVLFRSVARVFGRRALGVVLTGMGQDGLRGAREIVDSGGTVISQSRSSCVVWGMPRVVEEAGLSSAVVDIADMAHEIVRRVDSNRGLTASFAYGGR